MDIFEQASKSKLRFETTKGSITTDDLWDLPLTSVRGVSLDGIAIKLNKEVAESSEESFVATAKKSNTVAKLKFDIVKHIIDVKIAENAEKLEASTKKAQKERILGLIADKQDEELAGKSVEELQALIDA
jgi:hypothetical protein